MGIYALGRLELAAKFENEDPAVRAALIDAQVFILYQRQLSNLSIQEGRLRRQREKDAAALRDLQAQRKQRIYSQVSLATSFYKEAQRDGRPFDLAEFGFEISMQQIHERLAWEKARREGFPDSMAQILSKRAA